MFICQVFSWIFCTTIVAASGQFVFQPKNASLRNLVINNNTGEVFVGGENFIYKLNQNLGILHQVYTPCILEECKPEETVVPNINQLLMIENLTGAPRLFACGTYVSTSGACVTYDMTSLSQHTVLEDTIGVVSTNASYTSIALQDPQNKGILIASTRIQGGPSDYSANLYGSNRCRGTLRPCIGKKATLALLGNRPKIYYILAVIVGRFRYFFSFSKDGSSVARLCESYKHLVTRSINTYMEMPLRCVGKDGTNFGQLVAAKVVRPDGKLAENFGSTGNYEDAVFVGVFQKSSVSSQSAVCTYTFKQINEFFSKNIQKCFSVKPPEIVIRNKYLVNQEKCVYDQRITTCPDETAKNKGMIGTIKYESQALVTCNDCGFISSMDATIYRGNIVAFLGAKTGMLNKFLIYSNSSGRKYEASYRIPGSKISSVNFDPSQTSAYLLSEHKVLKIPVEECGNRTTCESCVKGGDPYCGWCTLYAVCTTYDNCSHYGSLLGYVQNSSQCINVSLSRSSLPLSETRIQKVNISIVNLPTRQKKGAYGCSVNDVKMPSTLFGDTMECSVPKSPQLPEPSSETGIAKAEVAVYSNETDVKIISATLEFYKCSAISSCLKCTTGSLVCSWCHYKAECSADAQSICSKSFAPWVSSVSKHKCPQLKNQTLYIPASVERGVTVFGTQLPKPEAPNDEYKCTLSVGSQLFTTAATWNNSTSITCAPQQYKYSGPSVEISANLSIKLSKSDIMPDRGQVQVYLYRCQRTAKLCGSCVGFRSKPEYKCGWCENTGQCSVYDDCFSGEWTERGGECPGIPQIHAFSPKTGHVAGNSILKINGTEFGRMFADVDEVSIAGLQCSLIEKDYVIAKRIVCMTNSSEKSLSAKVKVVISGKIGYSEEEFHYQSPQVEDYEPKIGPLSGGTYMTIYGKELNTGVDIQVHFGRSRCLNLSVTETNITCKTSVFTNKTRKRRSTSHDENLRVTFDGLPPVYSSPNLTAFQYVPDPVIIDITPRFTFNSSQRQINVTGTNLNGIHFPKIRLTFEDKTDFVEGRCFKPSFSTMICPLPDLGKREVNEDLKVDISLFLDAVTKWEDLSLYPQFNSLTIVPDPVIYRFPVKVYDLKTHTLEIKGKHLEAKGLFEFIITVGGEKCNVTSIATEVIFCNAPDRKSLPKQENYNVWVNISASSLEYYVGKLKYDIGVSETPSTDMELIYIILGVGGAVFVIFVILMCCLYRSKKRQRAQDERTYEMQMNSLESKVAKECREAFAELQTDMTDFTSDLGDAGIHFFDFKSYAMRVLFPGVEKHAVIEEKMAQESPKWDEALRTFSQLIGNKNFLLIFVKTLENQNQFKMQDRCNVASLLVIALQSKMDYCTDILQHLLAELIRKSMSKSHPKLLLRRTECIAEKLLTNWLTFTLSTFIKDKAGKPLFMLYKAIRFQVEKGPVDAITNEARYSLSEDKLLRQSIDYIKLTVTVEFEDNPPVQVEVLDTDTIEQAKEKIMEVLFKNTPFSVRIPKDELTLKWVESPSNHTILKDEDVTSVREGEWKRLNTLGHYQVPDGTCLRLVRRFASAFDTSEMQNTSLPKVSYSPSLYSTASLVMSSKQNISDADRKPWHLTKHVDSYAQEKDDPRHSKLLSEIYLTRLLSTKGTLQQYVDDMFDCIFPTFRKNERPPLPIKFLFDFLDDQARELNITDPEVRHTWKNNSLPLRFWVNLIKNPNFLFDVNKEPIVDSCLSVIAQLFMDACSVSEHILGKDSPSNKLLYAKEIPAYKQKVESFYSEVANAPRLTEEEVKEFFEDHYTEDFNVDSSLKQLYTYAAKYQDELQEALEDSRYPQLASKLEHVVAIFSDD